MKQDIHEIPVTAAPSDESMIDAKQAAAALRLPYYWFADNSMRAKYRIPHYLLGGLVRYRMSELSAWAQNAGKAQEEESSAVHETDEGAT